MYTLGIDVGSSFVKCSLLDVKSGECVASCSMPEVEMPIKSVKMGWAEQSPQMWWEYVVGAVRQVIDGVDALSVKAIGVSYQMHGLVCLDVECEPTRDAIIWCDSRAAEIGNAAFKSIGPRFCMERLLNSPGNFTASKLAWVREYERSVFDKTAHFMLPGDYIVYRMTGRISTTICGLSEQIMWDFRGEKRADFLSDYYGIRRGTIPEAEHNIAIQGYLSNESARIMGLAEDTPISYRAGDQLNNAFSLNVLSAGEVAIAGGSSGVIYGVFDKPVADALSRVNTFLHVNHTRHSPSYAMLLCINGAGVLNAWVRRVSGAELSYEKIDRLCESVSVGSDGVIILPFGNGIERMLGNRSTGALVANLDLNSHGRAHLMRAAHEGIAFAFRYGMDIMRQNGLEAQVVRACNANLFLSPVFRATLAALCNIKIELYNTDGSLGAARGAALGVGLYVDRAEAFASLRCVAVQDPDPLVRDILEVRYSEWKKELAAHLK